jgi:hypothetical protein
LVLGPVSNQATIIEQPEMAVRSRRYAKFRLLQIEAKSVQSCQAKQSSCEAEPTFP